MWKKIFEAKKPPGFVPDADPVKQFDLLGPVGEKLLAPTCICTSESGEIVVTDTESCFIIIYNSSGDYLSHFSTLPQQLFYCFLNIDKFKPQDVAWLSTKRIVFTQPKGCKVCVSDWVGKTSTVIEGRPLYEPYGVCVDRYDKIYIADRIKGRLLCYSSDGKLFKSIGTFASTDILSSPHYVKVGNNGDIYVNEIYNGQLRIKIYGEKRTQTYTVCRNSKSVGCLMVDSERNILQVNLNNNTLTVCTLDSLRDGCESDDGTRPSPGRQLVLASQLSGIDINRNGELVCIDQKEKKVKMFPWIQEKINGASQNSTM